MPARDPVPGISPVELASLLQTTLDTVVLDIREPYEWTRAYLQHPAVIAVPLSVLAARGTDALPEELQDQHRRLVVMCHLGERSQMVTAWLRAQGWSEALNLEGGIQAYALQVDRRVGLY